jgi:inhibitor of KinA sporulation pathway (predicted exonuclease)
MNGIRVQKTSRGEIIEIGAVLLDDDFNVLAKYRTYVKPDIMEINEKVIELTGIQEEMLYDAPKLSEALTELLNLTDDLENTTLYTWSESDTFAIKKETKMKDIHIDGLEKLCNEYVDVQEIFGKQVGIEHKLNLTKAMNMVGLEFEGKEHGALADAINTANLLRDISINKNVKKAIESISEYMDSKPLTSSLGNLFSKLDLNIQ